MEFKYVSVKNVSEYLEKIKDIKVEMDDYELFPDPLSKVYFRGEPQHYAHIQSSLFRGDYMSNNLEYEQNLINEALLNYPNVFRECQSNVDKLVKMQHFALPTRLIDITQNPLIALYFACSNEKNRVGRVLLIKDVLFDLNIVNYLINISQDKKDIHRIRDLANGIMDKKNIDCTNNNLLSVSMFIFENLKKPILFKPHYWNDRIRNQQGLFILTPIWNILFGDIYENMCENYENIKEDIFYNRENIQFEEYIRQPIFIQNEEGIMDNLFCNVAISVPIKYKEAILEELEQLGINEAFVYPDPEHQLRSIKTNVQRNMPRVVFNLDL